jgi:hypothetical protein
MPELKEELIHNEQQASYPTNTQSSEPIIVHYILSIECLFRELFDGGVSHA